MKICETIPKARSEMKQRTRWFSGHPRVAVGRARSHALEKPKHTSHLRNAVERGNDVYFRCAGIRKTRLHASGH
jgi:hypothetical protein